MKRRIHRPNSPFTPRPANASSITRFRRAYGRKRPVNRWDVFEAVHREADDRQRAYQVQARTGFIYLPPETMEEIEYERTTILPANNLDARLRFAWELSTQLDAFARALKHGLKFYFVTVVVRDHTVREDEAVAFSLKRVQGVAHQLLRGLNYLGMVEGAYYTNFKKTGAGFDRAVSWHFHAIVWGLSETAMKTIRDRANETYADPIPGIKAVHYRLLTRDEVMGQALYMSKGQISSYKVWAWTEEKSDPETGEVTKVGTGRFTQRKGDIRSGEMARMYRVMTGRTLNQFSFAGGEGKPVLISVLKAARRDGAPWNPLSPRLRRIAPLRATSLRNVQMVAVRRPRRPARIA